MSEENTASDARPVVYVVAQYSWGSGDLSGCLLLSTGEVLWSHISSSEGWLRRDLTDGFTDRRERLEALYPEGYEVVYVDKEGVIPEEVLVANATWKAAEDAQAEASSVAGDDD